MVVEDAPGAFSAVNATSLAVRRFSCEAHELLLPNILWEFFLSKAKTTGLAPTHASASMGVAGVCLAVQQQRQVHMPGAPVQRVTPETFHTWKQQKDEAKEQVHCHASWR